MGCLFDGDAVFVCVVCLEVQVGVEIVVVVGYVGVDVL